MITKLAHVKWFEPDSSESIIPNITINEALVVSGIILLALIVLGLIDEYCKRRKISKQLDEKLARFRPWVPTIVRLSAAALLLINTATGVLVAPNIENTNSTSHAFLSATFTIAGLLLLFGLLTRLGAALMTVGYVLSFILIDAVQLFDHLEYLGFGLYLLIMGGGVLSVDRTLSAPKSDWPKHAKFALPALRASVGLGLVVLAFSEKFFNVAMSQHFLDDYGWNFLSAFGVSDRLFILVTGTVEVIIGLSLILNKATRLTSFALLIVMTITAILLGPTEIAGHVFAVGVVVAIWVNDKKPSLE